MLFFEVFSFFDTTLTLILYVSARNFHERTWLWMWNFYLMVVDEGDLRIKYRAWYMEIEREWCIKPFYTYVLSFKPLIKSEAEDDLVMVETSI